MGEHSVEGCADEHQLQEFMKALLADLRALACMLEGGLIASGERRMGAEQEMFLVDRNLGPAPLALKVLERAGDKRLLARDCRLSSAGLTDKPIRRLPLFWTNCCRTRAPDWPGLKLSRQISKSTWA